MIPYASTTNTLRNLEELRKYDWRLLISAPNSWRTHGFRYALDNGAWTAYQQKKPFDCRRFVEMVDALAENADWVVLPDIVAGGLASLDFSLQWKDRVPGKKLLAVQDGMQISDVRNIIGPDLGVFVGGTTQWKENTMGMWGSLCKENKAYLHVARVNSARRIHLCGIAGADSFDGTSATKYCVTTRRLDLARKQLSMVFVND